LDKKPNWLATYVEKYANERDLDDNTFFMVAYRTKVKPGRMFYYRLEQLLTAVGGRRIQKSVVIVPKRALTLVKELCNEYDAEVFEAPFGPTMGSD